MTTAVAAQDNEHAHAHHHGPKTWPNDPHYGRATVGKLGMWVFLLTDAISFAGFLLAYGILRGGSEVWRHPGEPLLGINFTGLLTFLLICSSVTMVLAVASAQEGKRKETQRYLALTILGGLLFLCGQYSEWFGFSGHGLIHEGLVFGQSHYATTFYLITGFHGLHVTTGVIYLSVILIQTSLGWYDNGNYDRVEIVGLFWHFVDLIWIIVFTLVYLIPQ